VVGLDIPVEHIVCKGENRLAVPEKHSFVDVVTLWVQYLNDLPKGSFRKNTAVLR
jgi:hypothetical protein